MTQRLTVRAPAKINEFLAVGRLDSHGYHPLRTIFQAVGVWDEIHIEWNSHSPGVVFDLPEIPNSNSVTRAIELFAQHVSIPPLRVEVRKAIPLQSGLGGGSSDAAAVLRVLQVLSGSPLAAGQLAELALRIGADVPFFLVGGRARAAGYGEILESLPDEPARPLVLACPEEQCPTGAMFRSLDQLDYLRRDFPSGFEVYNDFERVAPCACLDLIEQMGLLGASSAGLSGSGSAIFGYFESGSASAKACDRLREAGVRWATDCWSLSRQESLNTGLVTP